MRKIHNVEVPVFGRLSSKKNISIGGQLPYLMHANPRNRYYPHSEDKEAGKPHDLRGPGHTSRKKSNQNLLGDYVRHCEGFVCIAPQSVES